MKYYTFRQNNSGGDFIGPARLVIVKAASSEDANHIAEEHGVYFDGTEYGGDCECCGDRWYRASEGEDTPVGLDGEPIDPEEYKERWLGPVSVLLIEDGEATLYNQGEETE